MVGAVTQNDDVGAPSRYLAQGRASYASLAWSGAYEALDRADQSGGLGASDLELLVRSAYMLGRDDEYVRGLERATTSTSMEAKSIGLSTVPSGSVITGCSVVRWPVAAGGSSVRSACSRSLAVTA